jgi:hypothetical protein
MELVGLLVETSANRFTSPQSVSRDRAAPELRPMRVIGAQPRRDLFGVYGSNAGVNTSF